MKGEELKTQLKLLVSLSATALLLAALCAGSALAAAPKLGITQLEQPYGPATLDNGVGCGAFRVVFRNTPKALKTITVTVYQNAKLKIRKNASFGAEPSTQYYVSINVPKARQGQAVYYCLTDRLQAALVRVDAFYQKNGTKQAIPAIAARFDPKAKPDAGIWIVEPVVLVS